MMMSGTAARSASWRAESAASTAAASGAPAHTGPRGPADRLRPALDEVVLRAIPHGSDGHFLVIGSGQHDYGDVRRRLPQLVERYQPLAVGQSEVPSNTDRCHWLSQPGAPPSASRATVSM